jgi:hypothetical protein
MINAPELTQAIIIAAHDLRHDPSDQRITPEWRALFGTIRDASAEMALNTLSLEHLARIYQASFLTALPIRPAKGRRRDGEAKAVLLHRIADMARGLGMYPENPAGKTKGPTICNIDGWILDGEAF